MVKCGGNQQLIFLPELPVLPTVDDEVEGTIEDNKKVRDCHGHLRFINSRCLSYQLSLTKRLFGPQVELYSLTKMFAFF